MEADEKYKRAKKRVRNLRDFYQHLITYIVVNTFLFILNAVTSSESWWFIYPLLGWGIGLAAHGISVLNGGFFGSDWEEKKIKKYMEKDKR